MIYSEWIERSAKSDSIRYPNGKYYDQRYSMIQRIFREKKSDLQRFFIIIGSMVLAFFSSYLYMNDFFEKVYGENAATLSELITGPSVFKDYYKPADFLIPRHFLISFILFFALFYLLVHILTYFHEKLSLSFYVLLIAGGLVAVKQFFGYDMRLYWILIVALLFLHVIDWFMQIRSKAPYDANKLNIACTSCLIAYFGIRAFVQMVFSFGLVGENGAKKGFILCLFLAYVTLIFAYVFEDKVSKLHLMTVYLEGAQALLLCFLLSLFTFKINYNGVIESTSYPGIRILALVMILAIFGYVILKRKEILGKVHPFTLMLIGSMQLTMHVPVDAMFPVNLFHYGELTVPFTELISYHKIPYLDFFPIHGMCDYFFASINAVFLDGTYGSFFYAYYIGSMILVALVAYVVYKCFGSSLYAVAFTAFFMTIGEWYYYFRFVLVLPVVLIFFYKKIREDAYRSLIAYIVTSIISIAWYPAIGGSLAVALLLPLCFRIFSKNGRGQLLSAWKKENRKKYLPSFLATLLLGISFIPMFLGIVRYLKENVGISGYFPGDRLYDILISDNNHLFGLSNPFIDVATIEFSFMASVILIVGMACYYKKVSYVELLITVVVFCYMICSYTFGSIFAGERASIVNVVLLLLLAYVLFQTESKAKILPACILASALILNTYDFSDAQKSALTLEEISDQFVKLNGNEIGCERMGTVFMPAETAKQVEETAFVVRELCPEGENYLDFTNQSAFYMMFDKETPFSYCALYHGTSDATRKRMLEALEEELPKLILVAPYWNNDGGSISLRYKEIYQLVMQKGYLPYQYGSVCFLLSDDVTAPAWATDGGGTFYSAMTTSDLLALPVVWGRSINREDYETVPMTYEYLETNRMETNQSGSYTPISDNSNFRVSFSGDRIVSDGEYLLVHFQCDDLEDHEKVNMKLYFSYPDGAAMEEYAISCVAQNGDLLIPLYAYPMWDMFEMTTIRFDLTDDTLTGKTFTVAFELLKDCE